MSLYAIPCLVVFQTTVRFVKSNMIGSMFLVYFLCLVLALEVVSKPTDIVTVTSTPPCPSNSTLINGQYTRTKVLPCRSCSAQDVWATATTSGSAPTTITTAAQTEIKTVFPCLICPETHLTALATPSNSTSSTEPRSTTITPLEENGQHKRDAVRNWGNVTMYGFQPKVDLEAGSSYCGASDKMNRTVVDTGSNSSLQDAANQCIDRYYSQFGGCCSSVDALTDPYVSEQDKSCSGFDYKHQKRSGLMELHLVKLRCQDGDPY